MIRFVEFYNFGWNNGFADPTWVSSNIFSWTVVEPGVYHLAACFITFRPLFRWIVFDSPLSSFLSNIRLISGSKESATQQTTRATKRFGTTTKEGSIDKRSDRNALVPGFNESFVNTEEELHGLEELNSEHKIRTKRSFTVAEAVA